MENRDDDMATPHRRVYKDGIRKIKSLYKTVQV